jgi:hypothetical protein
MPRIKEIYNQAAIGKSSAVLERIKQRHINVAILQDAVSGETKEYCESLPFKELIEQSENVHNQDYCYRLTGTDCYKGGKIDWEDLYEALKLLPDKEGKEKLAQDIRNLSQLFCKHSTLDYSGACLFIFTPSANEGGFWHTDKGKYRATATLRGDIGTIWSPDHFLDYEHSDRKETYWGDVEPDDADIQIIQPYDMALFKCQDFSNPLVHATPPYSMTRKYRFSVHIAGV